MTKIDERCEKMREIHVDDWEVKPVSLFKRTWGALTSGNESDGWNAMTISWGSVGTLWGRGDIDRTVPICNVYVRPSRFTHHLMMANDEFTVSFLGENYRKSLGILGSKSGRDDPEKIKNAGLSVVIEGKTAYLAGSDLVLVCRKIYHQSMSADHLIDKELIDYCYKTDINDFHDLFVGEILKVLVKDETT